MIALVAVALVLTVDKVDDALAGVATKQAEVRGRKAGALDAIEKAIRHVPPGCPKCERCDAPIAVAPALAAAPILPPPVATARAVIPWWVWVVVAGAAAGALATGVGIGVAAGR